MRTNDRDIALSVLFAEAENDLEDEAFTARVMARIERRRRWSVLGWVLGGLVLAACAWLIAAPAQEFTALLTRGITTPLVGLDDGVLAYALSPVNNVATAIVLGLVALRWFYKSVLS